MHWAESGIYPAAVRSDVASNAQARDLGCYLLRPLTNVISNESVNWVAVLVHVQIASSAFCCEPKRAHHIPDDSGQVSSLNHLQDVLQANVTNRCIGKYTLVYA